MAKQIIYFPGFGSKQDGMRVIALKCWRIFGVRAQLVPMNWHDKNESFEAKLQRARQAVLHARRSGYDISLIGESAGGSMALNIAAIESLPVLTICGVDNPAIYLTKSTKQSAPAFVESVRLLSESLKKLNISSIHTVSAAYDTVVHSQDSTIVGAKKSSRIKLRSRINDYIMSHSHEWLYYFFALPKALAYNDAYG